MVFLYGFLLGKMVEGYVSYKFCYCCQEVGRDKPSSGGCFCGFFLFLKWMCVGKCELERKMWGKQFLVFFSWQPPIYRQNKLVFFLLIAWSPSIQKNFGPSVFFFALLVPLSKYFLFFYFSYFDIFEKKKYCQFRLNKIDQIILK